MISPAPSGSGRRPAGDPARDVLSDSHRDLARMMAFVFAMAILVALGYVLLVLELCSAAGLILFGRATRRPKQPRTPTQRRDRS